MVIAPKFSGLFPAPAGEENKRYCLLFIRIACKSPLGIAINFDLPTFLNQKFAKDNPANHIIESRWDAVFETCLSDAGFAYARACLYQPYNGLHRV